MTIRVVAKDLGGGRYFQLPVLRCALDVLDYPLESNITRHRPDGTAGCFWQGFLLK